MQLHLSNWMKRDSGLHRWCWHAHELAQSSIIEPLLWSTSHDLCKSCIIAANPSSLAQLRCSGWCLLRKRCEGSVHLAWWLWLHHGAENSIISAR